MIPKTTTPLTKFIRTLEGVVVVVVNGALIVVPIVTSALPASTAVKYGALFNGIVVASRSILKAIASLNPVSSGAVTTSARNQTMMAANTDAEQPAEGDLEQGPSENEVDTDFAHPDVDLDKLDEPGTPQDQVTVAGATKPGEGWTGSTSTQVPGGGTK